MNVEIEKKYIIKLPNFEKSKDISEYTESLITQIYLFSENGITHRIRSRETGGVTVFTETKKVRIDKMSAYEDEREITGEEFDTLLKKMDTNTRPIKKVRHTFRFSDQLFEIDVYPEWKNTATLETELDDREKKVEFPDFIEIVKEVTGDKRYSNAGMSRSFPPEEG